MSNRNAEFLEQLKQAAREGLRLRNHLLELAEDLPSPDRERVRQTAGKLITFGTKLREIAATLPTDPDDEVEDPDEVRARIEWALENYLEAALDELQELIDEREAREAKDDPKPAK